GYLAGLAAAATRGDLPPRAVDPACGAKGVAVCPATAAAAQEAVAEGAARCGLTALDAREAAARDSSGEFSRGARSQPAGRWPRPWATERPGRCRTARVGSVGAGRRQGRLEAAACLERGLGANRAPKTACPVSPGGYRRNLSSSSSAHRV